MMHRRRRERLVQKKLFISCAANCAEINSDEKKRHVNAVNHGTERFSRCIMSLGSLADSVKSIAECSERDDERKEIVNATGGVARSAPRLTRHHEGRSLRLIALGALRDRYAIGHLDLVRRSGPLVEQLRNVSRSDVFFRRFSSGFPTCLVLPYALLESQTRIIIARARAKDATRRETREETWMRARLVPFDRSSGTRRVRPAQPPVPQTKRTKAQFWARLRAAIVAAQCERERETSVK